MKVTCLILFLRWTIDLKGAEGTIYEGEQFQLMFKFSPKYPFESPAVTFTGSNIPVHPHVYSKLVMVYDL